LWLEIKFFRCYKNNSFNNGINNNNNEFLNYNYRDLLSIHLKFNQSTKLELTINET